MELLIILGPPAVGKATVGAALAERTRFKLFHNHMSLDPVTAIFEWGSPPFARLVGEIRQRVIEEAAEAGIDLIFTYVWAFDDPGDRAIIEGYRETVEARGGTVAFVELAAEQRVRMARNGAVERRRMKARSHESSTPEWIAEIDRQHRFNSDGDFPYPERYLRIDNTHLSPAEVAERIIEAFGYERIPA